MFSIDEFNSNINRSGGLAKSNQYLAVVSPPRDLSVTGIGVTSYHLSLRIDSFEFPSRSVVPIEYRDYGPIRPIGGQANFTDVSATVLMSSDFREREFFMKWQDLIVGNHRDMHLNADQVKNRFDVGYFDDYKSSLVEIRQYNQTSRNIFDYTYAVRLVDCFPSLVGNMTTSWEGGNEIQKMNITFSYRNFVEDFRIHPGTFKDLAQDFILNNTRQTFEDLILRDVEPGFTRGLDFLEDFNEGIGL